MENASPNDIPLKSAIKEVFIDWCQSSTAHAIPNVAHSKNILIKIVWICCFLTCTSYCIYSVVISTQAYLSNQSFISSQIIFESPTDYPAITLCNLQTVDNVRAEIYLRSLLIQNGTPLSDIQWLKYGSPITFSGVYSILIKALINSDKNVTNSTSSLLGFELKDMLLGCTYNLVECKASDFSQTYHPMYGNCYTFNKNSIMKSTIPGNIYGLVIEIFTGINPKIQKSVYGSTDGFVLSINNQSKMATLNSDRIIVSTGSETDIKISRNFVSKLGKPYSNCQNNVHYPYSQDLCYLLCYQKKIVKKCGCNMPIIQAYNTVRLCNTFSDILCFVSFVNENITTKDCVEECPLECDFIEYKTTSNKATYPSSNYKELLAGHSLIKKTNISLDDIEKSVAKINVYYESMTYTSIIEAPAMSAETFFSNIGGTLGLYLGISILSIVEIVELAIKICQILYIKYSIRKTKNIK